MNLQLKKRVVIDFEKLNPTVQKLIKLKYPNGFHNSLFSYDDKTGKKVTVIHFATDNIDYLLRVKLKSPAKKMKSMLIKKWICLKILRRIVFSVMMIF